MHALARSIALTAVLGTNAGTAFGQPRCVPDILESPIPAFESSDSTVIETLLRLGHDTGLCFAIEFVDPILFSRRPSLVKTGASVSSVVLDILDPIEGVSVTQHDGVVTLQKDAQPPPPLLATPIHGFVGGRAPIQSASYGLHMQLRVLKDPSITGFAGSIPSDDANDLVGPFNDAASSVRAILNRIVCTSGQGGMWIWKGVAEQQRKAKSSAQPDWFILGYRNGFESNRRKLEFIRDQFISDR